MSVVPDMPAPRFGTLRNPQRETLGPKVALVARQLGWELMPWQRYVLDVGCEIDPATGLFWYKDVRVLAPRQSGKTSLVVPKAVHRAVTTKNAQIIYTAQNRTKSLRRLEKNFYARLLDHWAPVLDPTKRNRTKPGWNGKTGSESIDFVTRASIFIDAATEKSGQGDTNHEWHGDELYAHQDATIANNIRPTLIAVPGSQAWLVSAAGKMGYSTYWWGLVEDGRAVAQAADPRSRIMYVEWSDDPEADREDRTRWPLYLPAYGITIFEETMEAELQAFRTDLEQYDRAYRGIWSGSTAPDPIIPVEAWNADAWPFEDDPIDWSAPPMWVVDMSPLDDYTSVAVAGKTIPVEGEPDRRVTVRLVDHELGSHWAVDRLRELRDRFGGDKVAIAAGSRAMSLKLDLEDADFDVVVIQRAEVAAACGAFYDDAVNRRMWHGNDDPLNEALAGAAKRSWGDAWVWWRGRSMSDVSPLYAATLARHAYLAHAEPDYNVVESVF